MPRARLRLLGGFEFADKTGAVVALTSRKGRALLAYLALNPDRRHDRGELAALLWGGRGETQARDSLKQCLLSLRKALGDGAGEILQSGRDGVTLNGAAIEVDAARLRALAGSGDAGELAAAAALCRGELLAGSTSAEEAYEDWLRSERESVQKDSQEVFSRLAELSLEGGDGEAAVAAAAQLVALDPLDEGAHRLLMRAYDAAGQRSAALAQYQACKELLSNELGVAPEAETEALFQAIRQQGDGAAAALPEQDEDGAQPALPGKPSIAVLPFDNMSGDPEQDYFADGIAEDITTALARFSALFVIARNTAFTYKGRSMTIEQIGRELGVRYLLEGSIRRGGDKVRVNVQLIEAASSEHIWAETYDGPLADIFALQDRITQAVASTIEPKLEQAAMRRAAQKHPASLDAYDHRLRAIAQIYSLTREGHKMAVLHANKALEIDPDYAEANALAAAMNVHKPVVTGTPLTKSERQEAVRLAKKAVALAGGNPEVLSNAGLTIAMADGQFEAGLALVERALEVNVNSADAWAISGWLRFRVGDPAGAIEALERAMRLNPHDPKMGLNLAAMAASHMLAGDYREAVAWAEKTIQQARRYRPGHWTLIASHAHLGEIGEAKAALTKTLEWDPGFSIADVERYHAIGKQAHVEILLDGLRKAGVPE